MAKREQRDQSAREREEAAHNLEKSGEVGGFSEEARRGTGGEATKRRYPGRTIGDTATSYSSVGGAEEPDEWQAEVEQGGESAEEGVGPVHEVSFRPGPGGHVQAERTTGRDIPYTGEVVSTRDSTFEEDPDTGKTAAEEEGEFIRESLEERTRGYESG